MSLFKKKYSRYISFVLIIAPPREICHIASQSHSVTCYPAAVLTSPSRLYPSEAGTRFSNPGGTQGCVDLLTNAKPHTLCLSHLRQISLSVMTCKPLPSLLQPPFTSTSSKHNNPVLYIVCTLAELLVLTRVIPICTVSVLVKYKSISIIVDRDVLEETLNNTSPKICASTTLRNLK